jgi:hypothetical protein
MSGIYDSKLVRAVARETRLAESTEDKMTLENNLLTDGSLSVK